MSYIAFDSNTQASKALNAPSVRPSPSADRGTPSPFDSMIDNSQPPAEAPSASARDDNPPRADRNDRNQAQSADRPDRPAKSDGSSSDNRANSADAASGAPAKTGTEKTDTTKEPSAKDAKGSKDAKSSGDSEKAATDVTKKTAGDATTTDAAKTADAVATAIPTQTPVAVAVTVAAATTVDAAKPAADDSAIDAAGGQKAQLAALAALQAEAGGKIDGKIDGKLDGKADLKADAKADKADKKSAGKAEAGKTAPVTPGELDAAAKAQGAGEADKDPTAHAQAKAIADTHRGVTPDTQAKAAPDNKTAAPKPAADIARPTLPPVPTQQAQAPAVAATAAAAPAQAPQETAVPFNGIGIEIASKALSGKNQFDIRLDPPDLGRIHVRLDVDKNGNVITHMVADRTDTLDMLRRDSAGLERALQDAGLKTSDNSMQFSLRDQSANQQQSGSERGGNTAHLVIEDEHVTTAVVARDYGRYGARAGGLDIRV